MKRILLLLLLMCSASAWAQDVIVKRDGSTIVCRVVEVNKSEVIYKRWGNLEGPNYVMNLTDISAVNYENGEKIRMDETQKSEGAPATITTTPLSVVQKNTGQQMVSDDELLKMTEKIKRPMTPKAKKLILVGSIVGGALVCVGTPMMSVGIVRCLDNYDLTGSVTAGTLVLVGGLATGAGCIIRAHNLRKKANSQYSVQTSPLYQHDFTLKNGSSFSAGVDMLKDNTRHNPTLGVGLTYNF